MTRFEAFAKESSRMVELLELVCNDALAAKGCSLELLLPPNDTGSWEEWLDGDIPDEAELHDELRELARRVDQAAMEADYEG